MRDPGVRSEHTAEVQVGLLVLLSLVVLVGGVMWLTGTDFQRDAYRFFAVTPQAEQISDGTRVFVRGVDVGSVRSVGLRDDEVVLQLQVRSDVSLPVDSRAVIRPSGFLGTQMVQLVPGRAEERIAPGDTISAGAAPDLSTLAASLSDQVEEVLGRTRMLLADTTVEALHVGASHLSGTLREVHELVEAERATISSLVRSLDRATDQLADATEGPELREAVQRLDSLTLRLNRAATGLDASSESLASILAKTDAGEGSLGRMVNDEELYERMSAAAENLQSATEEMALLARDMRDRPERYLRGMRFSIF